MKKPAPYRFFYDRTPGQTDGVLTIQDMDGKPVVYEDMKIQRLMALSGNPYVADGSWLRGLSPIPYSREAGPMYLWLKPIATGAKPGRTGIGESWPISNRLENMNVIAGKQGQRRTLIRFHLDNALPGSAGCIVMPWERATDSQKTAASKVFRFLHWCRRQNWDYLLLDVV